MVKFISAETTYSTRWEVLRKGKPFESAKFPEDSNSGSFHLGYFENEELVCVASFIQKQPPEIVSHKYNSTYQLRGMATLDSFQGRGFGKIIMQKSFSILNSIDADLIWCNARIKAVNFYENLGFEKLGDKFMIPEIGEHYIMAKPL